MRNAKQRLNHNNAILLDAVITKMMLKNDAALSRFLEVPPPIISKMRSGKSGITGDTKILIHEKTAMSIAEIQAIVNAPAAV